MKKGFYIALLALVAAVGNVFSQSKVISGGNDHGILICAEGYIYAWGNNFSSIGAGPLLGIDPDFPGNTAQAKIVYKPQRVKTSGITFNMVTAGSGAANIALSCKSIVYAWGDNQNKECGQGKSAGNVIEYPVPVLKGETPGYTEDGQKGGKYLGDVVYVAANTQAAFAILGTGEVVGWGTGAWSNGSGEPMYIKTPDGKRLQNVVHVAGGDANCTFRTEDGKLYSIGTNNGNDDDDAEFAVPVLEEETGEPLANIRMSGLADKSGFAVQAGTGFVYSWGDGGWGGQTGQGVTMTSINAGKVIAGEYGKVSGEEYLTNVKEIVGGRGSAAAITEDGYLLYWGCNDDNGGVVPDPTMVDDAKKGPVFAYYCQPGTTKKGKLVDNAVHVSRGDNFFFVYDDENHFYSWGMNDIGQCGVGAGVDRYGCLTQIEDIPCEIQDECPDVFLVDQLKCPGEEIELNTSFVISKGKEHSYYFEWYLDGKRLNTSTLKKSASDKYIYDVSYDDDEYNFPAIKITKPGTYKVIAYYIGSNRPCDSCEPQEAESVVTDMDMPVDTVITLMNCVAEPMKPAKSDIICFEATVNDFYKKTDDVTFAAFATADSKDTLTSGGKKIIISTYGNGGKIEFCVTGDQIKEIVDNSKEETKDTIYNIWLEDITSFKTYLFKDEVMAENGYPQDRALIVNMYSSAELFSFDVYAKNSYGEKDYSFTPKIYTITKDANGKIIPGDLYWTGKKQTFTVGDKDFARCTIECNIKLPANSVRGTKYIIAFDISENTEMQAFKYSGGNKMNSPEFATPTADDKDFNIFAFGALAGINGSDLVPMNNVIFGKLTDYDCGRIQLSARYGCPPCNRPLEVEITSSETIIDDVDPDYKKVVELCKESDALTLDVVPLVGKEESAVFDILWFDQNNSFAEEDAVAGPELKATTFKFTTDWATVAGKEDIEEDVEKVYYVMVRDNEKPLSSDCYVFDSIKVIAHPAPVDSLDWIEFCEGDLTTEPTFTIDGKTIKWTSEEPTNVAKLEGPTSTGTKEYTFGYTVVDDKTGCEGKAHTLKISVSKTAKPDVETTIQQLKHPTNKFQLSAAVNKIDDDCEIRWYESETATSELGSNIISLDKAQTIEVWAEQYNTETGCVSERVMVEIIINDAPVPEVTNESLCLGNEIPDLSEYVKAKDANHVLNWYSAVDAEKGTGNATAPSFSATAAGTYKFYVSQTNTETNAESEKATLTITVHEVATLDLSTNKTDYCINSTATALEFTANNDGDFTTAMWSKKSDMTDASATLTPSTNEKGAVTYYVQAQYENTDAAKSYASTVCLGKIQDIEITTSKTDVPTSETNYTVQYLKAEGDLANSYKPLLSQDNTAVNVSSGCTLNWYDENKNLLASEPAPQYLAVETEGERKVKYYVSQTNTTTGCESELTEVTAIISSFPAPEVTSITLCEGSDKLKTSYPLTATISTKGGFAASDYELVWYKEDPKANSSATEYTSIDLNLENLSYDSENETEKDFKYYVVQRYLGTGGGQSPASELLVTLYSKPILKTTTPDPICLGGQVDLKELYTISNRISNQEYELEYYGVNGDIEKTSIATQHGRYKSRAYFKLASGEVCVSQFKDLFVTVNELKVSIEGPKETCPGIGVELKAVLDTVHMGASNTPKYSWNISPSGVTGQMETLNTSAQGLSKKDDKITVNLEVSMGACKGKKPTDAHIVTVIDPGVNGTIKFDEQYNTNSGKGDITLSKNGVIEFDGCNSKVEVSFNVDQTEDEFTYENLATGEKKTGTFSNGNGLFDIKAGLYEVTYTNTCATSFKFDVKDKSLDITGSPSSWSVCEGTPLTIKIVNNDNTPFNFDSRKYQIEWQKDGTTLPGFSSEVLYIPSTTPADNGVYSYTVTSSGCVYHDKIAMGGSFTSKPKVKVNTALLENNGVYEVIRTKSKDITIPFIQPTDVSKISNKIIWKEDGVEVNKGETLSLASVDSDHEYNIVIANGEKGSDTEFCGTSLDITIKADALLTINTELVNSNGDPTSDMCVNEDGVGIQIDTTGTGKVLHPNKFTFKVVETINGVKKDIKIAKKNGILFAKISPDKSATYDIVYTYSVGNQDESKTASITVHPAYKVEWDRDVHLCEGETGFIQITKCEPSDVTLEWEEDECIIGKGTSSGANVEAIFSGSGLSTKKTLTLTASNGFCAPKKYYPNFVIDKSIDGKVDAPSFVCEGHPAKLDASSFKATEYEWSSKEELGEGKTLQGEVVNVVPKSTYATYLVKMTRGACTSTEEVNLEVRTAPKFDRIDSLSFRSIEIVLQTNTGTAPYQYIVDNNKDENVLESVKDNLTYGKHKVTVIDDAGCKIDTAIVINTPGLEFPIHISPNGDGKHDVFEVSNLSEAYPDANIRIYNRWGKVLAEYKAGETEKSWDGSYNGAWMPSTDYWYEIEIKEIKKTFTGHFTLIRQ